MQNVLLLRNNTFQNLLRNINKINVFSFVLYSFQVKQAHRKYILTQGPLPQTSGHFWLMAWEQQCKAILMLNKVIEKNQIKCHQYWPLEGSSCEAMMFPDVGIKVEFITKVDRKDYTVRTLR